MTAGSQQQACCVSLCTLLGRASVVSAVNQADTLVIHVLATFNFYNCDERRLYGVLTLSLPPWQRLFDQVSFSVILSFCLSVCLSVCVQPHAKR